jgi:hypothetical protein
MGFIVVCIPFKLEGSNGWALSSPQEESKRDNQECACHQMEKDFTLRIRPLDHLRAEAAERIVGSMEDQRRQNAS